MSLDFFQQVESMASEFRRHYDTILSLPGAQKEAKKYSVKMKGNIIEDFSEQLKYLMYFDVMCCYCSIKDTIDWKKQEAFPLLSIIAVIEDYHPRLQYEKLNEQLPILYECCKRLTSSLHKIFISRNKKVSFYIPLLIDSEYTELCKAYLESLTLFTSIVAMADGVLSEQEWSFEKKFAGEKLRILSSKEMDERMKIYYQERDMLKKYGVDQVFLDVAIDGYRRCGANVFDIHEYLDMDFYSISQAISKMEKLGLIDHNGHPLVDIPSAIEQMKMGIYPHLEESSISQGPGQDTQRTPISIEYFNEARLALDEFSKFLQKLCNKQEVLDAYSAYRFSFNGEEITEPIKKILLVYKYDFANAVVVCKKDETLNQKEDILIKLFLDLKPNVSLDDVENNIKKSASKVGTLVRLLHNDSKNLYKDDVEFINFDILLSINQDFAEQYLVHIYRLLSLLVKVDGLVTDNESAYLSKLMEKKNIGKNIIKRIDEPILSATFEEELNSLIGLESVKKEITTLANFIRIQKEREKLGLKTTTVSYHCVFTGNPGTGKTTVARIVARIYKELGVLQSGHLIETDRAGLIGEYLGQTAVKTNAKIDEAIDGVLFIDEAYSITEGDGKDLYGEECVAALLKRMEDDRERLAVIVAGYTKEMEAFIQANPGFQSRFNRYIEFPDYSPEELFQIFVLSLQKLEYTLTPNAEAKLRHYLQYVYDHKDANFGNGRFVRNVFEKTTECQANRLAVTGKLSYDDLTTITESDIPSFPINR